MHPYKLFLINKLVSLHSMQTFQSEQSLQKGIAKQSKHLLLVKSVFSSNKNCSKF